MAPETPEATSLRALNSPAEPHTEKAQALEGAASTRPRGRRRMFFMVIVTVAAVAFAVCWVTLHGTKSSTTSTSSAATPSGSGSQTNSTTWPPSNFTRRPVIAVFGDSTTQYGAEANGWEVLLHQAYTRSADTINRGLSGYNTRLFLQYAMPGILDEFANYYKPTVAVIWFGVNDGSAAAGNAHAQRIPVDEFQKNLVEIVMQMRKAASDCKILLMSPCYIDEKQRHAAMLRQGLNETAPIDRTNNDTSVYAAAVTKAAEQLGTENVEYLDIYDYFNKTYPSDEDHADLLRDGLHFSDKGNKVFYELVKAKIETMVPAALLEKHQFPDDNQLIDYSK